MDALESNPYDPPDSVPHEPDDIPLIALVRMRQSVAVVFTSLGAGLIGWFSWITFRQGDHRLLAIMSGLFGGLFLLLAAFSAIILVLQSVRFVLRYRRGMAYFFCVAIAFALLSLPFFFH